MALVITGTAIVVAQGIQPPRLSDFDRLAAHPEAQLHYPGSVQLYDGGFSTTALAPAERWQLLATSATHDEILAFYVGELTARGYVNGGPFGRTSEETNACSWSRDLSVRIGFSDPVAVRRRFKIDPKYATVFVLRLIDVPGYLNSRPCTIRTDCELKATPESGAVASPRVRCRFMDD